MLFCTQRQTFEIHVMRTQTTSNPPVKLLPRKRFQAQLSNGDIRCCIVRQGEEIHVLGERRDGSLVALRKTYGGPSTWLIPERPMNLLLGMGAQKILIDVDYSPISFTD